MSAAKPTKRSRSIPEHIKRAVNARDQFRCRNCGVHTEFIHYDHNFPFDLGGPTTVENIQSLCPKCNTSKGNKITCPRCRHWFSPDKPRCPQCGAPLAYSKYKETLAGRLEHVVQKVGKAVVIGGAAAVLLILLVSGIAVVLYVHSNGAAGGIASQGSNVASIINQTVNISPNSIYPIKFTIPNDAVSGRVAGGFRVTSGDQVNALVIDEKDYQSLVKNSPVSALYESGLTVSKKINRKLDPGSYYLIFRNQSAGNSSVAAEFYVGHK